MTRGTDLQRVVREGKRIRTAHLDVRVIASPLGHPRLGIVVPKHRHTAVQRNRLKRQLRELCRVELLPAAPAVDVVIRARAEAYRASFAALAQDVSRAAAGLSRAAGGESEA